MCYLVPLHKMEFRLFQKERESCLTITASELFCKSAPVSWSPFFMSSGWGHLYRHFSILPRSVTHYESFLQFQKLIEVQWIHVRTVLWRKGVGVILFPFRSTAEPAMCDHALTSRVRKVASTLIDSFWCEFQGKKKIGDCWNVGFTYHEAGVIFQKWLLTNINVSFDAADSSLLLGRATISTRLA
jgi:hypothetical protein